MLLLVYTNGPIIFPHFSIFFYIFPRDISPAFLDKRRLTSRNDNVNERKSEEGGRTRSAVTRSEMTVIYQARAFTRKEIRYERTVSRGRVLTKRAETDPNDHGARRH